MPKSKVGLKSRLVNGEILTEDKLHDLIEESHNEVEYGGDFETIIPGVNVSYVKTGNVYSFWFNGISDTNSLTIPESTTDGLEVISSSTLPILELYQGGPMKIPSVRYNPNDESLNIIVIVDSNGIRIKRNSNATSTLGNGMTFACQFVLVLG